MVFFVGGAVDGVTCTKQYIVLDHHYACLGNLVAFSIFVLGKTISFRTNYTAGSNFDMVTDLAVIADDAVWMKDTIITDSDTIFDDHTRC